MVDKYKITTVALAVAGLLSACVGSNTSGGIAAQGTAIQAQSSQTPRLFQTSPEITGEITFPSTGDYYTSINIKLTNKSSVPVDLATVALSLNAQTKTGNPAKISPLQTWELGGNALTLTFVQGNGSTSNGSLTITGGQAILEPGKSVTLKGGIDMPTGGGFNTTLATETLAINGAAPAPAPTPSTSPMPAPSVTPTQGPTPVPTQVPPANVLIYPENIGSYKGGTQVLASDGKVYQCLSDQLAGWCNQNNWAYAPAKGQYWSDAWKLVDTPTPPPATTGELDVIVDTTRACPVGSSTCNGLKVTVSDSTGNPVATFTVPEANLGAKYTQPINNLLVNSTYKVSAMPLANALVNYNPADADATITANTVSYVTATYEPVATDVGSATISLPTVLASYTNPINVIVRNTVNGQVMYSQNTTQGTSLNVPSLPVTDATHQYSVELASGIASPVEGKYYKVIGSTVLNIAKDKTTTFAIPLKPTTVALHKVNVSVSGLLGSDTATVTLGDANSTYSYVQPTTALGNTKASYYVESGLNVKVLLTANGSSTYQQSTLAYSGVVTTDTPFNATFAQYVAPKLTKINATYWSLWGNNTSYDLDGGSYKSVPVDAPNIDKSYNLIIASFIVTDSKGNYVLATSDPGAQTPQTPYYSDAQIINMVNQVKAQNRKVIISLGGQFFHLQMTTDADRANFVAQVKNIVDKYGFQGIDLDLEGSATGASTKLLGDAVKEVVDHYRSQGKEFLLTMAPEWLYIAPARYGCGQWGSGSYVNTFYIDLIKEIGVDRISYIMPQTYNQGPSNGVCNDAESKIAPTDGMDKFVAALAWGVTTESGYKLNTRGVNGTIMPMIPPSKFVIGIPATIGAAGGGMSYVMTPEQIASTWNILNTRYKISTGGFMNWAADWDATPYSNASYNFNHKAWETGQAIANTISK